MAECPYCASSVADDERYCPRCGERLTDLPDREGVFDKQVVQYLDGVRNGARALNPGTAVHERFERQLAAAVGDFAHLADLDVDLRAVLDVDDVPAGDALDVDTDGRRLLGLVVMLGLADDAFPGATGDELLALYREHADGE